MKKIILLLFFFFLFISNTFAEEKIFLVDSISPFFNENEKIDHYSNLPYYQLDLPNWKVDEKQLNESMIRFEIYIQNIKKAWYTHIIFDDLNHLLLLNNLWIYKNTDIEKRNKIYRKNFEKIIDICKQNWIWIFITTDLQFYTKEIQNYLWKENFSFSNSNLLTLNQEAFKDIFESFPYISWIITRIWEWGGAYDSTYYKSKIIYDSPEKVNNILKNILPIFEKYNKKLIFRTWSIWVWEIWDIVVNKKTYEKTFSWINSANLLVSIKYTLWDYFWFDKLNPTIWYWNLKQIVEFEVRREYEWWWDFPNFILEDYLNLKKNLDNFDNVVWIWHRVQTWWWWYWKNILFNFGFNFWNEINFYNVNSRNTSKNINFWIYSNKLTTEEKQIISKILVNSRNLIKKGFYIDSFRKQEFKIKWIYIPSLLWIWWDRPTSSVLILSLIYSSIDNKNLEFYNSLEAVKISKEEFEEFEKVYNKNSLLSQQILYSLENRYRIFEILHLYKNSFFDYFSWREKSWKKEILIKINEYEDFIKDKPYLHFDFREVTYFLNKKEIIWEKFIFLFLAKTYLNIFNLFYFIIFILVFSLFFYFLKIKRFYKIIFILTFLWLFSIYCYLIYKNNILLPSYFNEAGTSLEEFI